MGIPANRDLVAVAMAVMEAKAGMVVKGAQVARAGKEAMAGMARREPSSCMHR